MKCQSLQLVILCEKTEEPMTPYLYFLIRTAGGMNFMSLCVSDTSKQRTIILLSVRGGRLFSAQS